MKSLLVIAALMSNTAFAGNGATAAKWVEGLLNGKDQVDILGKAQDGHDCVLSLSQNQFGFEFVGLGFPDADYVGLATLRGAEVRTNPNQIVFTDTPMGENDRVMNTIMVELDQDEVLLRAVGSSKLKALTCFFK
jgi:hypothetical protein